MIRSSVPALLVFSVCLLQASSTTSWEMTTYADFARGRFSGLSLSRDGRVVLAPKVETLFASGQPAIWSVDAAEDGTLYIGTGHRGRVYRIAKNGKAELLWNSPQPEVFAVAAGPDGTVYAGTSPSGKVFLIDRKGKATEFFDPKASYIWSLAVGPDKALYVGTGDGGRVYRVAKPGQGEIWYETGQSHVTALAFDTEGRLLAGSDPNGILYRITAKDKAFVLYDADLPEVRTISVSPEGAVYAAALGGSIAQKAAAAATDANTISTTVTAPVTSITVTEQGAAAQAQQQPGPEIKPKPAEPPKTPQAAITPGATVYTAPQADMGTIEKSAVYRINPDNTVETLWSSKEENVYDLLLAANDEILFSTDSNGRIYRLAGDRSVTLLLQTNEGETTRLIPSEESIVAATSTAGRLLRIGGGASAEGFYESPVHDAGSVSRWGQLSWHGQRTDASSLVFRTRAGNSARPDRTWSEWSEPLSEPRGSNISSPNARFVQWRAEFRSSSDSPSLTGVTVAYLPQNNPPVVQSINVTTQTVAAPSSGKTTGQQTTGTYSITVTDSGDAGASSASGTPAQTLSRGMTQQIYLTWVAEDPDSDRLVYAVYFRGEDETQWKRIRENLTESTLMLDGEVLADGKYFFRIVASDKQANAASSAREAELISPPVLFDNTPPTVQVNAARQGTQIVLTVDATDASSMLRAAEYSLDAAAWMPLAAADGVADGAQERFSATLDNVPAGEHLIVVRAFDAANNTGLAKVVVR